MGRRGAACWQKALNVQCAVVVRKTAKAPRCRLSTSYTACCAPLRPSDLRRCFKTCARARARARSLPLLGGVTGGGSSCAVGFSGVIFGLVVVDVAASSGSAPSAPRRSVFGLFTVPAPLYPWLLLVLWQLLMPSASFVGHLSGVLVRLRSARDMLLLLLLLLF